MHTSHLYETDFYGWTQEQVTLQPVIMEYLMEGFIQAIEREIPADDLKCCPSSAIAHPLN